MKIRYALIALAVLSLGACDKKKDSDARTAKGEVLDGTIADSELPLDTVSSQPPLAPHQAKPGAGGSADASDDADDPAAVDAEQPTVESAVE